MKGKLFILKGLVSRPELNGCKGTIVGPGPGKENRVAFQPEIGGKVISVRKKCLKPTGKDCKQSSKENDLHSFSSRCLSDAR